MGTCQKISGLAALCHFDANVWGIHMRSGSLSQAFSPGQWKKTDILTIHDDSGQTIYCIYLEPNYHCFQIFDP